MKKYFKLENLVLLFYIIFSFILVLYHEPWRDEAQAWLIVRDLNVIDIFRQLKYEGHPFLWYLILFPFAKLGFPYKFINIISWLFGCFSATIIVKKTSFNNLVKYILLFTPIFLYYCNVLGRSYCLCLFLVLLLSVIYKDRENKPILYGIVLFLIANTHILLLGFVGAIVLIDFYELIIKKSDVNKKRRLIGLGISISGLIVVVLQLIGCIGLNHEVSVLTASSLIKERFLYLVNNLLDNWGCEVSIIFILFILLFMFKYKKVLIIFLLSILFQFCVFTFVYPAGEHMISLLFVILIFCCCLFFDKLDKDDYNKICCYLAIIFVVLIPKTINLVENEFKYLNSDSIEVAKYIKNNIKVEDNILCTCDYTCSSIVPYFSGEYKFINVFTDDVTSYTNWGVNRDINLNLLAKINGNNIKYVIYSSGTNIFIDRQVFNLKKDNILEDVYFTNNIIIVDEKYQILKVNN